MRVETTDAHIPRKPRTVALGNFDGVHRGHQALLHLGEQLAKEAAQEFWVVTFYPQPQALWQKDFKYLIDQQQKMAHFAQFGVDGVLALPFDEGLSRTKPEDFVLDLLLEKLGAVNIVAGFNYSFGYQGAGDAALLTALAAENGARVHIVPPVYDEAGGLINSSAIRAFLRAGEVQKANRYLGYPFSLTGEVIHGHKVGRTIGIPTANLAIDADLLLPANGVYAAKVVLGNEEKMGVLNVGMRPTVDNGDDTSVEVHILDFDRDIYGQTLTVYLHDYLRGESKFAGLDGLKAQIERDKRRSREILAQ